MADLEACVPPADDPSGGCCKAALRTILHVAVVLSATLFPSILSVEDYHYLAFLVPELVAYAAVGRLYIYNSGSHEKLISAGYIVLVLPAFLLSTIGISRNYDVYWIAFLDRSGYDVAWIAFLVNMVVISTYCIWKLSFILPMLTNMVPIPSRQKRIIATILHAAIVTILFAVVVVFYAADINYDPDTPYVIQLAAYNAVGCLYMFNSSRQKEQVISAGFLVLLLLVFLLSSLGNDHRITLLFAANIVAISTYCIWQLSFILPIPLSLKKTIMATILHAAVLTILLAVIQVFHAVLMDDHSNSMYLACLVFYAVAYDAVGFLYICNSSRRKEKVKSAGFLLLLLFLFLLLSSFTDLRTSLIFVAMANILSVFSYCIWKLYLLLRRWFDALDGDVVPPVPREQAHQEAVLQFHPEMPFRIQEVLREFSSDEIQAMTRDFGSMVGRGGSAQVFRGNLDDGTPIAVKRINIDGGRNVAGEEDFRRELSIIANVHHRSLVRLLGYRFQRGVGLYLVYPFFENGSLDRWIFHGSEEQRRLLTWPKRFCIAVDVARALAYLHNECHWRILHLDVKPGNILLDADLRAHVSDFGISLSITRGLTSVINTRGRGTLGYMAPEMLVNSVSDRSDVFSYGKTLLELVGGRPNFVAAVPSTDNASSSATPDLRRDYFPYMVRDMMTRGELMNAVDAAMADDVVDEEDVKTLVEVALCCIQEQPNKRPRMQDVVDILEGRVSVNLPPESHSPSAVISLDSVSSLSE